MYGSARKNVIKAIRQVLSTPWSDKFYLAEMATIAREFYQRLDRRCQLLGVVDCQNCGGYRVPGDNRHICPQFDRSGEREILNTRPPKYSR
jgi:hypothetical protein